MNALREIVDGWKGRPFEKWKHYFHVYDQVFSKFRGQSPTVLEIGVDRGGSLELWSEYFGEGARVIGCDISPAPEGYEGEFIQADQDDYNELERIAELGPFDIVIDDGGHTMSQQIKTFIGLHEHIKPGGVYVCEDTHTSYVDGYGKDDHHMTWIEFAHRSLVDGLHSRWSGGAGTLSAKIESVRFYDSLTVATFWDKPFLMAEPWPRHNEDSP